MYVFTDNHNDSNKNNGGRSDGDDFAKIQAFRSKQQYTPEECILYTLDFASAAATCVIVFDGCIVRWHERHKWAIEKNDQKNENKTEGRKRKEQKKERVSEILNAMDGQTLLVWYSIHTLPSSHSVISHSQMHTAHRSNQLCFKLIQKQQQKYRTILPVQMEWYDAKAEYAAYLWLSAVYRKHQK